MLTSEDRVSGTMNKPCLCFYVFCPLTHCFLLFVFLGPCRILSSDTLIGPYLVTIPNIVCGCMFVLKGMGDTTEIGILDDSVGTCNCRFFNCKDPFTASESENESEKFLWSLFAISLIFFHLCVRFHSLWIDSKDVLSGQIGLKAHSPRAKANAKT